MESERLAQEHELSRQKFIERLEALAVEAMTIDSEIEAFEKTHADIKVIANGDLTLQQLIKDAKATFLQAWEDRKIQLTRQAKIHLMKQLKNDVNSQIQTLKFVNSLPEAKNILQGLERGGFSDLTKRAAALSDDRIPESSETLGAIKLLQETMKVLKEKLDLSVDYFNLIQSMDRMVGETNEALQKQMDSDFFPENSDQSRNMIEKILKALKDVFSESEARLSYLGTYSSYVFTNPEFPTGYCFFEENFLIFAFCNQFDS